jgi:hypothetical protein
LAEHELFFDRERNNITSHEVIDIIDNNRKGLSKRTPKFHSLVIAPDAKELRHIGHDTNKLKEYIRDVMNEYAKNFTLSNGQYLSGSDLIWFAKLERARNGIYNPENMHVHIVVSARNISQNITLNPLINNRKRFNRVQFYLNSERAFDRKFEYNRLESKLQTHQIKKNGSFGERLSLFSKRQTHTKLKEIAQKYSPIQKIISSAKFGFDAGEEESDRRKRKRRI